jgi:HNH endonuclease
MTDLAFLQKPKRLAGFTQFLRDHGAEILPATNEYEIVRFRATSGVNVIYRNRNWKVTPVGDDVPVAVGAFLTGTQWRAHPREPRPKLRKEERQRAAMVDALMRRDGKLCFYCSIEMSRPVATIEHLVARACDGPDRIENYVLAHATCNHDAGNISVMEKIKLREANMKKDAADVR